MVMAPLHLERAVDGGTGEDGTCKAVATGGTRLLHRPVEGIRIARERAATLILRSDDPVPLERKHVKQQLRRFHCQVSIHD